MFFRSGSAEELYDYGGEHFGFYHVRLASQRESRLFQDCADLRFNNPRSQQMRVSGRGITTLMG